MFLAFNQIELCPNHEHSLRSPNSQSMLFAMSETEKWSFCLRTSYTLKHARHLKPSQHNQQLTQDHSPFCIHHHWNVKTVRFFLHHSHSLSLSIYSPSHSIVRYAVFMVFNDMSFGGYLHFANRCDLCHFQLACFLSPYDNVGIAELVQMVQLLYDCCYECVTLSKSIQTFDQWTISRWFLVHFVVSNAKSNDKICNWVCEPKSQLYWCAWMLLRLKGVYEGCQAVKRLKSKRWIVNVMNGKSNFQFVLWFDAFVEYVILITTGNSIDMHSMITRSHSSFIVGNHSTHDYITIRPKRRMRQCTIKADINQQVWQQQLPYPNQFL